MRTAAFLALALFAFPTLALAKEVKQDFPVQGWSCEGCTGRTEKAVREVKGVSEAKASFEKKLVAVTFDDAQTAPDAIRTAIEKAGFGCPLPKK